jgi:tRNA-binding EMAP/Myf-like protein
LDGKILIKSAGVNKPQVNINKLKLDAKKSLIVKPHENPTVTRLYKLTLDDGDNYLIVRGVPKSNKVYIKETGITHYFLGLITFILCFYWITKRKMREIEEIALGLMEICKG